MDHPQPSGLTDQRSPPTQWTTCPACGAVAEIRHRRVLPSTAGPIEHVRVLCLVLHTFLVPVDALDAAPSPWSRRWR